MNTKGHTIILGSGSPRRRELLSLITTDFKVMPSDADETIPDGLSCEKAVEYLSLVKAKSIKYIDIPLYYYRTNNPNSSSNNISYNQRSSSL